LNDNATAKQTEAANFPKCFMLKSSVSHRLEQHAELSKRDCSLDRPMEFGTVDAVAPSPASVLIFFCVRSG